MAMYCCLAQVEKIFAPSTQNFIHFISFGCAVYAMCIDNGLLNERDVYGGAVERVRYDIGAGRQDVDEDDAPVPVDEAGADERGVVEPHGVGLHLRCGRDDVADLTGGDVSDDQSRGDAEADGCNVQPDDLTAVG